MNDTATRQGAARTEPPKNPDVEDNEIEIRKNPREAQLEAMAARQEELRQQEIEEGIRNDPDAAAQEERLNSAIRQSNAEAGIVHQESEDPSFGPNGSDNDGAASRQAMHPESPDQPPRQDLPSNLQDDPLVDFIEMHNNQPMIKAKVNGQDRLIPLAEAKRQLQIGVAAEVRMQSAAEREKQLEERERRLTASEAALSERAKTTSQPATPAPSQAGLSDEELEREATEIFETAFSGTEEDAAKKLAKTLVKIRDSAASRPTQQIDANAIARQAASMAVGTISQQERKKGVSKGYQDFKTNYPEVVADPNLFKMADDMCPQIEREHPEWDIAQVMDEAGKRTLEWVKDLKGENVDTGEDNNPPPPPSNQNSRISDVTTQTRQERKAGLVRMPTSAAAAQHAEEEESESSEQSPQDAFLELKKARGQPV